MSLIPISRLSKDSTRSPRVAANTTHTPKISPIHQGEPSRNCINSEATTTLLTSPPAPPSHDFFGLIIGAMGCLPNNSPNPEAPVSGATTVVMRAKNQNSPCGFAVSNTAKLESRATYNCTRQAAAISPTKTKKQTPQ